MFPRNTLRNSGWFIVLTFVGASILAACSPRPDFTPRDESTGSGGLKGGDGDGDMGGMPGGGDRDTSGDGDGDGDGTTENEEPTFCATDEHVADKECVSCSAGEENERGDDASGKDTSCDAIVCGADERVDGNTCTACPSGETNEEGDDSSGEDTLCNDACSAVLGVRCEEFDQAYLKASNTEAEDYFGYSVSLSGDTLAVGAYREASGATGVNGKRDDNSANASGAVYVFTRDTAGAWTQQAYLKASNTDADDQFGRSVSLSGDTLAVGTVGEDSAATGVNGGQSSKSASGSGAVYVFTRNAAGAWTQQAYLKASNTDAGDAFGSSVSLSEDTLAVGAVGEASSATGVNNDQLDNSGLYSGAVYVFARDAAGAWTQQAYLKASFTDVFDQFGSSVSLSGDTLAVGAIGEGSGATGVNGDQSDNSASSSGAVYVFARNAAGAWTQQAHLKASNTYTGNQFGYSISLSGDTLAVGTGGEDSKATGVNGDQSDNSANNSGAVYLFARNAAGAWTQQAYLKASNTEEGDLFGNSVSLSGDTLAVGAVGEASSASGVNGDQSDNTGVYNGAVYLVTRDAAGAWTQQAYLKASNTDAGDYFGYSVSLSGDTLAVGAYYEDSAASGVNGDQFDNSAESSGAVYIRLIAP